MPSRFYWSPNGSFSQQRTFKSSKYYRNEGQLTAYSVEKLVAEVAIIVAILSLRLS